MFSLYLIHPSKTLLNRNLHIAETDEGGCLFIAAVDVACLVSWSILRQRLGISVFQATEDATNHVIVTMLDAGVSEPWRLKQVQFIVIWPKYVICN